MLTNPPLSGSHVRLRRVTLRDADLLELWQSLDYTGEYNDFGLAPHPVKEAIKKTGLMDEHRGTLVVERIADGKPVGTVGWRAVAYGPNPQSQAWNIGINLVPAGRGHGLGTEAQRLLADHLFATTPAHRIEAATDVDNLAEQRSLEKAGFHREGVLRGSQFRHGAWHDLVVYSLVRVADGRAPQTIAEGS